MPHKILILELERNETMHKGNIHMAGSRLLREAEMRELLEQVF